MSDALPNPEPHMEKAKLQTTHEWWDYANERAEWLAKRAGLPYGYEHFEWVQACIEIFDCIRRNGGAPK